MECKKALVQANGDPDQAIIILRERGLANASKRAHRETREGTVGSYIHAGGKLGVLVEVNCETDFVARTEEFQQLVRDIAMHIAASDPSHVRRVDASEQELESERNIYRKQALTSGKPQQIVDKIIEGKLNKYYSEVCLYEQPFVKDPEVTVEEQVKSKIAVLKENISVRRFSRFKVGD